jgi:hypothetical protein
MGGTLTIRHFRPAVVVSTALVGVWKAVGGGVGVSGTLLGV